MYRSPLALAALLAMLTTAPEAGAACTSGNPNAFAGESTPTGAFTNHGNGTLTHNLTGLMWKQCAQGLSGAACATGSATAMNWRTALAAAAADTTAAHSDWRLPNKKELESIVESCGSFPAINQTLFPGTPAPNFWTGTSYGPGPAGAWYVDFGDGESNFASKTFANYVRLVRGGQYFDSFDAQQPTALTVTLDVDASISTSKYDALTDGLLIIRQLFGLSGTALTNGALGGTATRTDPAEIGIYLDGIRPALDIDSNGTADALTDGLLILRYLFGLRGSSLIAGAVDPLGARKSATDIETYIQSLMP